MHYTSPLTTLFLATLTLFSTIPSTHSTTTTPKIYPVMNGQNFPDPAILRIGNTWYGFATNAHTPSGSRINIQTAQTTRASNFTSWSYNANHDALPHLPSWVDPASPRVWAPDVVQLPSGTFIMYFSAALRSAPTLHCIGAATASSVLGPYTPTSDSTPFICPPASKGGAIDPAGYADPSTGNHWVVYKVDGNAVGHGGICNNGIPPVVSTPIMLQQVSGTDGVTKVGAPVGPLIVNGPADGPVVEAPSLTRMPDGWYVLFFSSNCFATTFYDVSYATSRRIEGPYEKYGPLFVTGSYGLRAPGGLDVAVNGDHAVFHADWEGGRAMFTALIGGENPRYTAYVKAE